MALDHTKIKSVCDWPVSTTVQAVRQFLGLASYYRRYIHKFADIAGPLHQLTQKGIMFEWTSACNRAFCTLKERLTQAPILVYPQFHHNASKFTLQTDASASGLGAVLEQAYYVVAYASHTLTKSERNYSVIQKECLAAVYAMKQFCHYLLGRPFTLVTDHAPLQWLSAQKMKGLLSRWALAIQEYDFVIQYREGTLNGNADALSRSETAADQCAATITMSHTSTEHLRRAQSVDPIMKRLGHALSISNKRPSLSKPFWRKPPLRRYRQLWSQLKIVDGVICREYAPGPTSEIIQVP